MSDEEKESIERCETFSRKARKKARLMDCAELLNKINELTDLKKTGRSGTKGLLQRFHDYKGDDATHGPEILNQQRALRTYVDEYISRGCGDPPPESVEVMERPLPVQEEESNSDTAREVVKTTVVVGGGLGLAYLTYRVIRMLPSLLPPLWSTIPVNFAVP